jgi:hypothetical protein
MNKNDTLVFTKAVAELVSGIVDADKNKDGKYSISEIWKVVSLFVSRVNTINKTYKVLIRDIRKADSFERQTIANEFKKYFNLSDKDVECIVEMWIQTLVNISDSIEETKLYLNGKKKSK